MELTEGELQSVNPPINIDELPINRGWLFKKGPIRVVLYMRALTSPRHSTPFVMFPSPGNSGGINGRAWRRRYFRLEGRTLTYYRSDRDMGTVGQMSFNFRTVVELEDPSIPHKVPYLTCTHGSAMRY